MQLKLEYMYPSLALERVTWHHHSISSQEIGAHEASDI